MDAELEMYPLWQPFACVTGPLVVIVPASLAQAVLLAVLTLFLWGVT